jgi:hypothetical protein
MGYHPASLHSALGRIRKTRKKRTKISAAISYAENLPGNRNTAKDLDLYQLTHKLR